MMDNSHPGFMCDLIYYNDGCKACFILTFTQENILLKGLAFQNKEDIPVVRQLVCRDGSIEDMEGSVILNGPTNNWCTPHPNSHFNWDAPSSQSAQR